MQRKCLLWAGWSLLVLLCLPPQTPVQAAGGSIKTEVSSITNGKIWLSFASRPGVRGDGTNICISDDDDDDWEAGTTAGPVHLLLKVKEGEIYRARVFVGGDLIFAASLADSVNIWPRLLDLAKDKSIPQETREACLFWLGQAVFALSRHSEDESLAVLARVARTNPHPEVRRSALFWLAQKDDPLVLSLFEEILLGKP
ncbi:MAG: hypothetical protein KJ970_11575 [Candidatus Eisenbacteria bacterium]|uniref:HEAT repeat domain-containing protein n=1 Tax=Eiseniibacteriota bacterium TaxID=2212470 RepID=A0A948RYP3_UNCEI|nr:hypothetical protein [Candidatus Eisenbacteria bacterium]MBU1948878.1 hypothetical protein [Candidatus Eisenbacteria bacterium]MBU2691557.1 hypothetical protein [Candidatus Eisenbacteria bacterium]